MVGPTGGKPKKGKRLLGGLETRRIRLNQRSLWRKWGKSPEKLVQRNITRAVSLGFGAAGMTGPEYRDVRAMVHKNMQRVQIDVNLARGAIVNSPSLPGHTNKASASLTPLVKSLELVRASGGRPAFERFNLAFNIALQNAKIADDKFMQEGIVGGRKARRRISKRGERLTKRQQRLIAAGMKGPDRAKLKTDLKASTEKRSQEVVRKHPYWDMTNSMKDVVEGTSSETHQITSEHALNAAGLDPKKKGDARIRGKIERLMQQNAKYEAMMHLGQMHPEFVPGINKKVEANYMRAFTIVKSAKGPKAAERFIYALSAHSRTIDEVHQELGRELRRESF